MSQISSRRKGEDQGMFKTRFKMSFALVLCFLSSCDGKHDRQGHDETVNWAFENVELVRQFKAVVPANGQHHWISYFDGYGGTATWNSFGKLYGRYKLTMQFHVVLDSSANQFKISGSPKFYLREVTLIEVNPRGGYRSEFGREFVLGAEEWRALVNASGDFSKLGIELEKNNPTKGFAVVKQ